jgi:hypothetical protein
MQQELFDNPCPVRVFGPAEGSNAETALSVRQLLRRFPGARLIAVLDRPAGASQPRRNAEMAVTRKPEPDPFDLPDDLEEQEQQYTVQVELRDLVGRLILIKPFEETTIKTKFGDSEVTLCEVIDAEADPAVHYDRVACFWTGMRQQMAAKVGSDRWIAGRLKKGTQQNDRQYWMESPKASDRKALSDALSNAVHYTELGEHPF